MQPHRGTLILVLGLLSLLGCAPFGIAAWIMGRGDLKAMDAGRMDPAGCDHTKAGFVCGIIGGSFMDNQVIMEYWTYAPMTQPTIYLSCAKEWTRNLRASLARRRQHRLHERAELRRR